MIVRRLGGLALLALVVAMPVVAHAGLFDPPPSGAQSQKPEPPLVTAGTPTTATEVVAGQNQMAIVQSNGAELLKADADRFRQVIGQGGFPQVPGGAYKKGVKGNNVAVLNRRLYLEGYLQIEGTQGAFADMFTTATQVGVARFQRNHGLHISGTVDNPTLAELNIPADKRLATIEANIPRLQAYGESLGDRYVVVNIPAQQLEAVQNGRVFERHNAIVGRPARPTPVVMTPLETVRFNPYWYAPVSIVQKDILPKLQSGTDYLTKINMKILQGNKDGPVADPKTLNFRQIIPENYVFRQEPGPENAMATAKIEFRSPFGIYLHDTPEKQMFNYDNRFFSSGCIRIQNVATLLKWVLNGQEGYDEGRIAEMAKNLQRVDVTLQNPPQLRVAYLTAWPQAGGTVAFRNDIYQMDGTGFVVGQPLAVGETGPDGKRFILKPLPHQISVDAAEAEGRGFFGSHQGGAVAARSDFGLRQKAMAFGKPQPVQIADSSNKPTGLFDWAAYRKRQAVEARQPASGSKVKHKKATKKLDCIIGKDGKLPEACLPKLTTKLPVKTLSKGSTKPAKATKILIPPNPDKTP